MNNIKTGKSQKAHQKTLEAYHEASIMRNCPFLKKEKVTRMLQYQDIKKDRPQMNMKKYLYSIRRKQTGLLKNLKTKKARPEMKLMKYQSILRRKQTP